MGVAKSLKRLEKLLDFRNDHPERLAALDERIKQTFQERHAIMVLDMAGFSRLTIKHGIIHFLAMIRRMQVATVPVIEKGGGRVVKTEADNIFAVFPSVEKAVSVARRIHRALEDLNAVLPEDWDIHVSIGIGHGDVLMVGQHDFFGSELNLASKLGEDLAEAGEVLLTAAAHARMGRSKNTFTKRRAHFGKLAVDYFQLKTPKAPPRS